MGDRSGVNVKDELLYAERLNDIGGDKSKEARYPSPSGRTQAGAL